MEEAILQSLHQALARFEEVIQMEKTVINRDAAILRFEFTIELAWKSMQKFLRDEDIECRSPKECLKEAFQFGLIEDDKIWNDMVKDRNLVVHSYYEQLAEKVYSRLPQYIEPLKKLRERLLKEYK